VTQKSGRATSARFVVSNASVVWVPGREQENRVHESERLVAPSPLLEAFAGAESAGQAHRPGDAR